jgi:hypothetical protein
MALYLRALGPFVMTTMLCVLAPAPRWRPTRRR